MGKLPPGFITRGEEGRASVDAQDFREMVRRCHKLVRVAVRQEVRDRLRARAKDFESEAEAIENSLKSRRARTDAKSKPRRRVKSSTRLSQP